MKILSRILIALLLLAGLAFLVVQSRAAAAAKTCQNPEEMRLGLDNNGCEEGQPRRVSTAKIHAMLVKAGIGAECYKLRAYKDHNPGKYRGSLEKVDCVSKDGSPSPASKTMQPLGTSQTQRIMFATAAAKDAFEKELAAAEPNAKKK